MHSNRVLKSCFITSTICVSESKEISVVGIASYHAYCLLRLCINGPDTRALWVSNEVVRFSVSQSQSDSRRLSPLRVSWTWVEISLSCTATVSVASILYCVQHPDLVSACVAVDKFAIAQMQDIPRWGYHLVICRFLTTLSVEASYSWQTSNLSHLLRVEVKLSETVVLRITRHKAVLLSFVQEMADTLNMMKLCLWKWAILKSNPSIANHIYALVCAHVYNYISVVWGISNHHNILSIRVRKSLSIDNSYHFTRIVEVLSQSKYLLFS